MIVLAVAFFLLAVVRLGVPALLRGPAPGPKEPSHLDLLRRQRFGIKCQRLRNQCFRRQ